MSLPVASSTGADKPNGAGGLFDRKTETGSANLCESQLVRFHAFAAFMCSLYSKAEAKASNETVASTHAWQAPAQIGFLL